MSGYSELKTVKINLSLYKDRLLEKALFASTDRRGETSGNVSHVHLCTGIIGGVRMHADS